MRPRVPIECFDKIEDEGAGRDPPTRSWHGADLKLQAGESGDKIDSSFRQLALTGVMMGDTGAVSVIQEAHTRMLLQHRVLSLAVGWEAPHRVLSQAAG